MPTLVTIDLDVLRADIAEKRKELAELEAAERAAVAYGSAVTSSNGHVESTPKQTTSIQLSEEVVGKTVHDAAAVVLSKAGRPMKTKEIVESLQAAGFGTNLANMQSAVFTAMDRKRETFRKAGPGMWTLVGHPPQNWNRQQKESSAETDTK